jgi:hypothetical protein
MAYPLLKSQFVHDPNKLMKRWEMAVVLRAVQVDSALRPAFALEAKGHGV